MMRSSPRKGCVMRAAPSVLRLRRAWRRGAWRSPVRWIDALQRDAEIEPQARHYIVVRVALARGLQRPDGHVGIGRIGVVELHGDRMAHAVVVVTPHVDVVGGI